MRIRDHASAKPNAATTHTLTRSWRLLLKFLWAVMRRQPIVLILLYVMWTFAYNGTLDMYLGWLSPVHWKCDDSLSMCAGWWSTGLWREVRTPFLSCFFKEPPRLLVPCIKLQGQLLPWALGTWDGYPIPTITQSQRRIGALPNIQRSYEQA